MRVMWCGDVGAPADFGTYLEWARVNMAPGVHAQLSVEPGRRYARVVRTDSAGSRFPAHAFRRTCPRARCFAPSHGAARPPATGQSVRIVTALRNVS